MDTLMHSQSAGVSKGLVADIAHERLLIAVDKHVLCESLFRREALVACGTNMGFVANMSLHVSLNFAPLGEPCSASLTAGTIIPTATEALNPFLSMLDMSFRSVLEQLFRILK
jgi:hypothetical protein